MAWMNTSREPTTPPPLGLGTAPPTQLGAGMDAQLAATNGTPELGLGSKPLPSPEPGPTTSPVGYTPGEHVYGPTTSPWETGPPAVPAPPGGWNIQMPAQPGGSVPPGFFPGGGAWPLDSGIPSSPALPPLGGPGSLTGPEGTQSSEPYTGPRNPQQATPGTGAMFPGAGEEAAWFDAELAAGRTPWLTLSDDPAAMAAQWGGLDAKQQQFYTDVYGRQNPEAQAMWRQAFGYVEPPAPGAPQVPGGPSGGGGPTQGGQVPGGPAQSGPAAPPGRRGSPSAAMAESQIAGQAPPASYQVPGSNEWTDASPNNYTGQYSHEAAWGEPVHQRRDGTSVYAPGYGAGVDPGRPEQTFSTQGGQTSTLPSRPGGGPGGAIKWDEGAPAPGSSRTLSGQESLNSPLQAGGQGFPTLQAFLDSMGTSSPTQFDIKTQLEGRDSTGGSRETGEGSLFDVLAPYLAPKSTEIPMNGTPFNNWDPTSLLTLLLKSGILQRPS